MSELEDAIGRVEALYRTLTGGDAPPVEIPYAPIPAERDPVQHVNEQMERLSRLLGGQPDREGEAQAATWMPPMSVWETQDELLFAIDLPGVQREGLEIGVHGTVVVVSGKRPPPGGEGARVRGLEHPIGAFRRIVSLPPTAVADHMSAWLKDGVLTLRVPREREGRARNISIS